MKTAKAYRGVKNDSAIQHTKWIVTFQKCVVDHFSKPKKINIKNGSHVWNMIVVSIQASSSTLKNELSWKRAFDDLMMCGQDDCPTIHCDAYIYICICTLADFMGINRGVDTLLTTRQSDLMFRIRLRSQNQQSGSKKKKPFRNTVTSQNFYCLEYILSTNWFMNIHMLLFRDQVALGTLL